jgi:hypothetical protein
MRECKYVADEYYEESKKSEPIQVLKIDLVTAH